VAQEGNHKHHLQALKKITSEPDKLYALAVEKRLPQKYFFEEALLKILLPPSSFSRRKIAQNILSLCTSKPDAFI
jgi:hypothetical protein